MPLTEGQYDGHHGWMIRMLYDEKDPFEGSALIDEMQVNLLVLGMTRSGKGECFVLPAIDMFSRVKEVQEGSVKNKPSMIVTDPKKELLLMCRESLEREGYLVLSLDLLEPSRSDSFNPLAAATAFCMNGRYDEMENAINILVSDLFFQDELSGDNRFFIDTGKQTMASFLIAHTMDCVRLGRPEENNLCSVAKNIAQLMLLTYTPSGGKKEDPDRGMRGTLLDRKMTYLDAYLLLREPGDRARELYAGIFTQPAETKENIIATASRKLMLYSSEVIAGMTSGNGITGKDLGFGERPVAVFVSAPETNTAYYSIPSLKISSGKSSVSSTAYRTATAKETTT